MNTVDIPLPEFDFELIKGYPIFNLIYPSGHPLSQAVKIDMVVRLLAFPDEVFEDILTADNASDVKKYTPTSSKMFEIGYIRECLCSGVTQNEWENNYGPGSFKEFRQKTKSDTDDYVKIINLRKINYSLKSFNKTYNYER